MKFSRTYQTTWHDTDWNRRVRLGQLLVYMQETSNRHVAHLGMDLDELRDREGLAFILSKLSLWVYRPLFAHEEIEVQTWTNPERGYSSFRSFRILRGGEVIAEAQSTWALLDIRNEKLCRFDAVPYRFEDEAPLSLPISERIRFPREVTLQALGTRRIVYSDLDYNRHMNNTRYPDMLCDFLPFEQVERIQGMTLSYLHEAGYGDEIILEGCEQDGNRYIRTKNAQGTVCLEAQVAFSKASEEE